MITNEEVEKARRVLEIKSMEDDILYDEGRLRARQVALDERRLELKTKMERSNIRG